MILDAKALGKRLRQARENRRFTQEQAAQSIGLPRTALVHIEAGNRSLSTLELSQLAKLYHRSVADFFEDEELQPPAEDDLFVVLHRLPPELVSDPEVNRQVSRCLELCRLGIELEKTLGVTNSVNLRAYEVNPPDQPYQANRQGERVAEEERRRLGLGHGPIADMADLLTTQGIWASGVGGLPNEMSGVFLRHSLIGMVILVHQGHARPRRRFSYAHEYAHALLDRSTSAIVSRRENSSDLIERRANAFAAAFLMPAAGVRWFLEEFLEKGKPSRRYWVAYSEAGGEPAEAEERPEPGSQQITYQDVAALAHYYDVSYQAAVYRLSDLNFVNRQEKASLLEKDDLARQFSQTVMREFDGPDESDKNHSKGEPDRELVSQIVRLAMEAYRREEVSQGWLREKSDILSISGDELIELAEAAAMD